MNQKEKKIIFLPVKIQENRVEEKFNFKMNNNKNKKRKALKINKSLENES